jgi:hypothetical protein
LPQELGEPLDRHKVVHVNNAMAVRADRCQIGQACSRAVAERRDRDLMVRLDVPIPEMTINSAEGHATGFAGEIGQLGLKPSNESPRTLVP